MKTKGLLKDKRKAIITTLCGFTFFICIICSGKVKATSRPAYNNPAEIDTLLTCRILPIADSIVSSLSFIKDSLCIIKDSEMSISAVTNELIDLFNGKDTVINIVHLGDSHIQAGFLSGRTMRLLQNAFGNAGRGWVAPFRLTNTNEPTDYFISSNIKEWVAGRCVQSNPKCPWGIGGIGIQTEAKDVNFNLIIAPKNGAGYSFNKVLMYRNYDTAPMTPLYEGRDSVFALPWNREPYENIAVDTFLTNNLVDTFSIRSANNDITEKSNASLYYGFKLMNSNPGILYHAIGVNGAKYTDYTNREYIRQLSLLKPSLLIISLGTNESFGRNFNKVVFESQIDALISLIREEMPKTALLITTPAESYKRIYQNKKRQYVRNENIAKVSDVISSYTEKNGIACWDLFSISGGNNSHKKWYDAKMFGRDRIHFSRNGYEEQGTLLYMAIMRTLSGKETAADANVAMESEKEVRNVE